MKRLRMAAVVAALLGLMAAGCAPMAITGKAKVREDAFGARKRLAVVTIASLRHIQGEKGFFQMFKKSDNIPGANTQPIIDELRPKIIKALARSKYFALMPENKVLRNRAYRALAEDERVQKVLFSSMPINVASRYKYFSEPEKFARLAEDLHADGVISILMSFSIQSGKTSLSVAGLSLGKKDYRMVVSITALAYDRSGKVIWKDTTIKEADPGDKKAIILVDLSDLTNTNFQKLHPSAVAMGEKAVGILLARFSDTMAGKSVSSIQSMK
jgi:hypothetical protein